MSPEERRNMQLLADDIKNCLPWLNRQKRFPMALPPQMLVPSLKRMLAQMDKENPHSDPVVLEWAQGKLGRIRRELDA